jgi:hypothetical protein
MTTTIGTAAELLALAEQCEMMAGPEWMMDCSIASVIGWPAAVTRKPYTASLDAAMALVPEDYGWRLWMPAASQSADGDRPRVTLWKPVRSYAPRDTDAATPALALCAAALRARAAMEAR